MTISLKHSFTSPKADGTDSTLVQPSNWNAEHTISLAAGKVLGRDSSGAGAMQELPISVDSTGQSMIPPSGTTAQRPGTAAAGMLRYNTTLGKIELYNGSTWGSVGGGGATVSDTAPSSPSAGDLWWKSDEGQMYVYYNDGSSTQWVIANALTNTNAYLLLSGGTLTGALSGTSAAFSGAVTGATFTGAHSGDGSGLTNVPVASGSVAPAQLTTGGPSWDSAGKLSFNSGFGSTAAAYGCRAWVNWQGSTGTIRGSGGVTSLTRSAVGDYTINFNFTMPDANYSATAMASKSALASGSSNLLCIAENNVPTTTALRVYNDASNNGATPVDAPYICVAVFR